MRFVAIPAKTLQQLVTLLLFRLGGEQSFTPEEVKDIQSTVGGIMMQIDSDNKVILRTRSVSAMPQLPPAQNQEDPQEVDPYEDDEMY